MAKPRTIPYERALSGINLEKHWTAGERIEWVQTSVQNWPFAYKHRSVLRTGSRFAEGLFVQLDYKAGIIGGLPERLYFGLFVDGARTCALDEDGVSGHINKIGAGQPFYRCVVGHPHVHIPVPDGSYGYAEPVQRLPLHELWQVFLSRANIIGAPPLELPGGETSAGQMRLL
ncbi:hypothetical protein [Pseudomonas sp. NPDC007930]|uniref:hypothetical protein n=1 Tax=Pseudomonas sp. NPDC007930 TaxID=3364417 RepID=UPI0036E39A55